MPAREVVRNHLSCILSFDLIGEYQNKRSYVTEIILLLMFANVIFWRKRSDDWTYVCGLQASPNTAARKKRENLLLKPISRSHVTLSWSNPRTSFLLNFSKTHELRSLKATFTTAFFATVHHNYNHKQRTLKHRNTLNRSKSADHEPWRDLLNALK